MPAKKVKAVEAAEEEREEETGADLFDQETAEANSLAELAGTAGGGSFDGDLLKMEPIINKKFYVLDYVLRPSTFREGGSYVCIQIKRKDGTMNVVNSTATVILKVVNTDKASLPAVTAFVKRPPTKAGNKPYWDFAHKEELPDLEWL